jgi:hypothetical protein
MRSFRLLGVLVLVSVPLQAQNEVAWKQAVEAARVPFERAMKGAPYSGETVVEASQTLADGNRINKKTTGRVYRDGEGRTRREEDRANGTIGISIVDPIGGFSYSLDPVNKIAWKTPVATATILMDKLDEIKVERMKEMAEVEMRRKVEGEVAAAGGRGREGGAQPARAEPTMRGGEGSGTFLLRTTGEAFTMDTGPLEHKTIEGIAVDGHRNSTLIPAGKIGNEQPIKITSEEWTSPELNVLVLTHHSDPRMGDSSYRLINIIRAEPDRSLFMVPPDYTVKETGIKKMLEASRKQ